MSKMVIFSTDGQDTLRGMAKAIHQVDVMSSMRTTEPIAMLFGMYKGKPEVSFACHLKDWNDTVQHSPYVQGQESILIGDEDNVWSLHMLKTGDVTILGQMVKVEDHKDYDSWTYDPATNTYWLLDN